MSRKYSALIIALVVIAATVLAACQPAPAPAVEEPAAEEPASGEPSGEIVVDGSSTVGPLTSAVAEEFRRIAPDVEVSVGISGTGGGFKKFCPGETDISDASRPIKDEERELCAENGVEFTEFYVAIDGLTVVANPANDFAQCLTVEELGRIFAPDSDVTTWADLNPDWPAEEIPLFAPDPDSGTRDYFIEAIIEPYVTDVLLPDASEEEQEALFDLRSDDLLTFSTDDNVLLEGVAGEEYGLGFFGYSYYINNQEALLAVEVDGGEGCVVPTQETVEGGTYSPLSRPLFIYVNNESLQRPEVQAFVRYYLSEGLQAVMADVGYVIPPQDVLDANLEALEAAVGG